MNKFTKALLLTAGAVIGVSAAAGGVAFVKERADEKKLKTPSVRHKGFYERFIKRPLDCTLAIGATIVFSPILAVTALMVRLKLGSPVLFPQERPGRDEKIFKLYKFRSMTDARDENGELLSNSERLTSFGQKLRSTSLDELPELFNIIKGDMAVVGPRPLLKEYQPYYTKEEHHRHDVRPGLTGLAQANGRNNISSWEERLGYDIEYVNNCSFKLDAKIILDTVKKVFKHSGVLTDSQAVVGRLDDMRRNATGNAETEE